MLIVEVIVEKCAAMEEENAEKLISKKERVEVHSACVVVPTRKKEQGSWRQ